MDFKIDNNENASCKVKNGKAVSDPVSEAIATFGLHYGIGSMN